MKRHRLDVISLGSGLLFAGLGIAFALHALGTLSIDVRVVPAVVLIVLGISGVAAALTSSARANDRAHDHEVHGHEVHGHEVPAEPEA